MPKLACPTFTFVLDVFVQWSPICLRNGDIKKVTETDCHPTIPKLARRRSLVFHVCFSEFEKEFTTAVTIFPALSLFMCFSVRKFALGLTIACQYKEKSKNIQTSKVLLFFYMAYLITLATSFHGYIFTKMSSKNTFLFRCKFFFFKPLLCSHRGAKIWVFLCQFLARIKYRLGAESDSGV